MKTAFYDILLRYDEKSFMWNFYSFSLYMPVDALVVNAGYAQEMKA